MLDGRFLVDAHLDSGTLAAVYRAVDQEAHRVVSIKVLARATGSRPSRRVQRDFSALQKLIHPNVARLYAVGITADGRPYLATEYLDGETLRRYLRRLRILTAEEMLPIAIQIANGLAAAHHSGVLHGDLKPENVFVTGDGSLKISDFGTVQWIAENLEGTGFGIGTPAYMAPERLIDDVAVSEDPLSDLYSLGIIEYEMLAGYNPVLSGHKALSRAEISWRQAAAPPRVPVGVPLELWSVLEPTLRKEPDRRPASAREHARQLERLAARLGTRPSAPSAPLARAQASTVAQMAVSRVRRSLLVGAAVGVTAGALVFAGWWLGSRQGSSAARSVQEASGVGPAQKRGEPSRQSTSRGVPRD